MGLREAGRYLPVLIVGLLGATAAFVAETGGGRLEVWGVRLSVRDWRRPLILLAVFLAWYGARTRQAPGRERLRDLGCLVADGAFLGIVLFMGALAARSIIPVAGGLDSYGYVSAAHALASGRLILADPLAAWLPLDRPMDALAPLGWVPSVDGTAMVPRFPLGLPAVMALFLLALGPQGPFLVAPLLGAGTVALTYGFVRRAIGPLPAAATGAVVAAHPVLFTYAIQPMSDVPATFWALLAVFLIHRPRPRPLLGGAAIGMATLTRPPLALVALALAGASAVRGSPNALAVASRVLAGFAPFAALLVALQMALYGSPTASGYGPAEHLFAWHAVPGNLSAYGRWLLAVNTPLLPLLLAAAGIVVAGRVFVLGLVVFVATALPYVAYTFPADDWQMLRFVLPGLIFLLMLAACAAVRLLERVGPRAAAPLVVALLCAAAAWASVRFLGEQGVFQYRLHESRYPAVGTWIARHTEPEAVVLTALHSGSVRHYAARRTVRWDQVPGDRLVPVLEVLERRGHPVFLVLDGQPEREEFARRFGEPDGLRIEFVHRVRTAYLARVSLK